ncbi:MAG: hypothetical protein JRM85_07975 [Nitrososphaerota archaeon]|nr:hypothetical protein [Nitrososphaerota archaeon]
MGIFVPKYVQNLAKALLRRDLGLVLSFLPHSAHLRTDFEYHRRQEMQ